MPGREPQWVAGRDRDRAVAKSAQLRKGRFRLWRVMSLNPDQRIAKARLEVKAPLAQRGGAFYRIAFRERREKGLCLGEFRELLGRRKAES